MDIRTLTPRYAVTPQITAEDIDAIKAAGFTRVICNRPDAENPPDLFAAEIEAAVRAAGLEFVALPLTYPTMTPEAIAQHMAALEADGPVLAYCASGTRCTTIWALGRAGQGANVDDILAAAARAGYDLASLRPRLDDLAASA
ncbi:TIGR01244 family sulfur transferase [Pseudooceanicola sp.]|uniref:TIGR01244 family sulfur transferase n=1 Tax=Pseudooceanicola sp. TaxID=1914328 RepID=UPI0026234F39|nr:TIGR01244 family sulfur transferase [Pseudooceanicola sp.]MDF1854888.1 TIGR01244 family sulfur transferase [Pseudooceanicola sp.]